jgi:hypothetical protein
MHPSRAYFSSCEAHIKEDNASKDRAQMIAIVDMAFQVGGAREGQSVVSKI